MKHTVLKRLLSRMAGNNRTVATNTKKRPATRLRMEQLEDRSVPAVTATVDANNVLTVTLSAAGDQAFITSTASGIRVGTIVNGNDVLTDTAGIVRINLQDSGSNANQAVIFDGTAIFSLSGFSGVRVSSNGIEVINLNQAFNATSQISGNATTVNVAAPGQIQAGINLAASGGTVNVAAGNYQENVVVNKPLSVRGAQAGVLPSSRTFAGPAESIVAPTSGTAIQVISSNVTVDGFSISGNSGALNGVVQTTPVSNMTVQYNFIANFTNSLGVSFAAGSSGGQVNFNEIFGNYAGVYFSNNANNITVSQNIIRNQVGNSLDAGSGIVLEGINPNININQNFISNNQSHGIYVWTGFGSNLTGTTVNNNSINGNGSAITNTNIATLNASGNWFGTAVPAAVASSITGSVDFSPYLNSGSDTSTNYGFQGDFSNLTVHSFGAQVGSIGRIQEGVNTVTAGGTVRVHNGTYTENVNINNKNLTLQSINGRTNTTIVGTTGLGLGTIWISGTTTGVQIGGYGQGFHIIGFDGPTPGVEVGAVYIQGTHSNLVIVDNEIQANGDHGLIAEFAAVLNNVTIDSNIFSGQTFVGPNPAGFGFSAQFTLPNVPRQLVVMGNGGGAATSNVTNLTFTNNQIVGTTGGLSVTDNSGNPIPPTPQGNTLVTLDVSSATISGNTFAGTTTAFASALRSRRPGATITGNTFNTTNMAPSTNSLFVQNNATPIQTIAALNTTNRGAYHLNGTTVWNSIQAAVAAAAATGTTVCVLPSSYPENITVMNSANTLTSITLESLGSVTVNPSSGNVFTIPNGVTASFVGTFTTTQPTLVQNGGTLGGTGTITGLVNVNSGGTVAPGLSTGILNTGSITFTSGSTFSVQINGPTVGTQYDQLNVTGTVNLGGATLSITLGYTPTPGTPFTIIANDSTDPVVGTFAGLPNGSTVIVGSQTFTIFYNGGDGNDVVLLATVPPGLGGRFDMQRILGTPTQPGYTPVLKTTTYNTLQGYGWVTPPAGPGYETGLPGALTGNPLAPLLHDGVNGYATTPAIFRIDLASGQAVRLTAHLGAITVSRDQQIIEYSVDGGTTWVAITPGPNGLSLAYSNITSVTGEVPAQSGPYSLLVRVRTTSPSQPWWSLAGLEVVPAGLVNTLTVTGPTSLPADGVATGTYTISGATPNTLVTVTAPWGGFVGTDASPHIPGFQVLTNNLGQASFTLQAPRAAKTLTNAITVAEVTGAGSGSYTMTWTSSGLSIDLNAGSSPTASGFVGMLPSQLATTANGFGWTVLAGSFDRGIVPSTPNTPVGFNQMYRDFHFGFAGVTGQRTFRVAVGANATASVTLYSFDTGGTNLTNQYFIVEGAGTVSRTGAVTTTSAADLDGDGFIDITVGNVGANWVLNGLTVV